MRLQGALRRSVALSLWASLALWFGACSSSQQQQQGAELENSNQDESVEATDQQSANVENGAGEENITYEENIGEQDDYSADATENELQEVIAQMNQESDNMGEAPAEALNSTGLNAAADPMATANFAQSPPASNVASAPAMASGPMVGGLPEMNSKMPYIVQKGDTLGKIAKKIYGDMNRWSEIKELSALHNPNRIYPGDVVYYALTPESTNFAQAYELSPKSEVTVQQGQSLANIAAQVYGDSTTWKMIWRLNGHIANPDQLEVGTIVHYLDQSVLISQNDLVEPMKMDVAGSDSFMKKEAGIVGFSQLQKMNMVSEFVML